VSGGRSIVVGSVPSKLSCHACVPRRLTLAQPGRLAGGAYAPSARRRLALYVEAVQDAQMERLFLHLR
jgi:hypothetical protein